MIVVMSADKTQGIGEESSLRNIAINVIPILEMVESCDSDQPRISLLIRQSVVKLLKNLYENFTILYQFFEDNSWN